MIYYINLNKKRLVGRNNNVTSRPLTLEYDVTEVIDFQFIDDNNQLQPLSPNTPGLTLAIGLKQNMPSYDLLALSHDYEIVNGQTLRFTVNTYTVNWLKKINKPNTEVFIEISQQSLESKKVWLRDYCYVWPRVYTAGLEPEEIASNDYYTKAETDEAIENAIEGISGFVTEEQFEEGLATKQNVIDDENKLAYDLLSGTPTIPTKTSDLTNDSDFVTSSVMEDALSGKQDLITNDNKLDYALISGAPEVSTVEWGGISGTLSAQTDLQNALNAKANTSDIPLSTSQLTNDSGFATSGYVDDALSGKQDVIDDMNWLPASLVRMDIDHWQGDPDFDVESAVNMTRDDVYAVSGVVSGLLSSKQDAITNDNKLDYGLLSGTPTIPLSTSQLTNDSGFITNVNISGIQIDVDTLSGELEDTDEMLVDYITEQDMNMPLYCEALESGTVVRVYRVNGADYIFDLEYKVNNNQWNTYVMNTTITLDIGDRIYFRRTGDFFNYNYTDYHIRTNSGSVNLGGNIMSIVDKRMHKTSVTANMFNSLFTYTNVIDASHLYLPAPTLNENSYYFLFNGCSNLEKAPKMMFTSLAYSSCTYMFRNTKITEIEVHFTDWNNGNSTYGWMEGTPASGIFKCPAALDTTIRDTSHIPEGWTVVNI